MVFHKKIDLKDAQKKYGFAHMGVFAAEPIRKHELVFTCDKNLCDYVKMEAKDGGQTRAETLKLFEDNVEYIDFIRKYYYMTDDDTYAWPCGWKEQKLTEQCMFINHGCDPNCGFRDGKPSVVIAIRDIEPGEELVYDYQCMDSEAGFMDGVQCACGSKKCRGKLRFDLYRNVDWQMRLYKYSTYYIKRKIDELKTKWYSSSCYLKYYDDDSTGQKTLGLTVFRNIYKNDLVAVFKDQVLPGNHYIRHSDKPTCYLEGKEVFALGNYNLETELTLNYDDQIELKRSENILEND